MRHTFVCKQLSLEGIDHTKEECDCQCHKPQPQNERERLTDFLIKEILDKWYYQKDRNGDLPAAKFEDGRDVSRLIKQLADALIAAGYVNHCPCADCSELHARLRKREPDGGSDDR